MVKSMDDRMFKGLLEEASKIGFKDGRMVLNNLSADGDEGKTNVILKRIVDEVHAEDVKKEEEATTLGIGKPRSSRPAHGAYLGDRVASSSPPPVRREPVQKRNKGKTKQTDYGSSSGREKIIDKSSADKDGEEEGAWAQFTKSDYEYGTRNKPVKFDDADMDFIDNGGDVEVTDLSEQDAGRGQVAKAQIEKYGALDGPPPPNKYRCGNPTDEVVELDQISNMEMGMPNWSYNRGISLLKDVNHSIKVDPKVTEPEEKHLIRDVNRKIMSPDETILGPQCNGMFSNLSTKVEGTDERPTNSTLFAQHQQRPGIYMSETSQSVPARLSSAALINSQFSSVSDLGTGNYNMTITDSNSYKLASTLEKPITGVQNNNNLYTARNKEMSFPKKPEHIKTDHTKLGQQDENKKMSDIKQRKNKKNKKEVISKGSDFGRMGELPIDLLVKEIEGKDLDVTENNKKDKKQPKAATRRKSKDSPVPPAHAAQIQQTQAGEESGLTEDKDSQAAGGDKQQDNKSKQRDEQSSNNQGKTGATQTKTGGSPSAAAVGDTVTVAAASVQTQGGNNKQEKQSPKRKKNKQQGQNQGAEKPMAVTSFDSHSSTSRPSDEGDEEFMSADEGTVSPNGSENRYQMVKETSTDSQSQQQPAVSQSGRKGKKSGSVGGIEKNTSVESGSGSGNGSVVDNNPSSAILLDAANYRDDDEDLAQIEKQFSAMHEEEFITVTGKQRKKAERRTGSAGASHRAPHMGHSQNQKQSSVDTAPSSSESGRRSSFGVNGSTNGGQAGRHFGKKPQPHEVHLNDFIVDEATKRELALAAKQKGNASHHTSHLHSHPQSSTSTQLSNSEKFLATTEQIEINTDEEMPLLPGANPAINGHSPANQPTQFSYANAVKKSAEPSRECSPNTQPAPQASPVSSTASTSPSPPPSQVSAPPPTQEQQTAKQRNNSVIESMPARRTEGITFYYDAEASGQDEQEDKQHSADESSSGCLTGFDESTQGEHSGHDLSDSTHNQSLGVHAFHVGGKSILLSTCGSNEVAAQAAAAADIIDMIRLMNERWQQFQEKEPMPILYTAAAHQ
ncbi:hypothetical protein WR25_03406 isoform B [Diploscapter pachys]|uniref:Uncharacterized protein n=1 Tax=Diploscapter pachys TaxID=2018661 RepID=A0A2A2LU22_9BILA|nr:hypothetical protein WR25_03406 isoform B [Diploscapter pachys]